MPHCSSRTRTLHIAMKAWFISLVVALLSLTGCGGGGGDSGANEYNANPSSAGQNPTSNSTGSGKARLVWLSPTRNMDGSCANDIVSYQISYGIRPGYYNYRSEQINPAHGNVLCEQSDYDAQCGLTIHSCAYTIEDLGSGNWYFVAQSFDTQGNASDYSNEASKVVYQ